MKPALFMVPLLALSLGATPALADPQSPPAEVQEARIPFVNHGSVRDWRVADRETLYIQDSHRNWYRATLMYPSHELNFAWAIGFDTGPTNTLDRFSSVVVRGERIPITSLVAVDGPPAKDRHDT